MRIDSEDTTARTTAGKDDQLQGSAGRQRNLYIVSAPSGAGKTTLCDAALRHFKDLSYSVSYTTRSPRKGEIHGKDYFFVSKSEFEAGIRSGRWAEWAQVHGHFYGTSVQQIRDSLNAGRDILMDIDVQGARQMVARFPAAVTIFIMPSSEKELNRRLQIRGTDDQQTIALRLANARKEMTQKDKYRHIIVNDDLSKATDQFVDLIEQYRCGRLAVDART
jgi:guanylate kinase